MKNEEMALLFSEATPYIQKYHGKTMVIKYGGNAMINETLKNAVMNDLVTLTLLGVRVVLVHGGGPAINEMLKKVAWRAICQRSARDRRRHHGDRPAGAGRQGEQGPRGKAARPRRRPVRHGRPDAPLHRAGPPAGPCGRDHPCGPDPDRKSAERRLHPGHRDGRHGRPRPGVQCQRRHRCRPDRHCAQGRKTRLHDRYRRPAAG